MIRTKITMKSGEVWYATAFQTHATPELTVAYLNKAAMNKKIDATYELSTEAEYLEFKAGRERAIFALDWLAEKDPVRRGLIWQRLKTLLTKQGHIDATDIVDIDEEAAEHGLVQINVFVEDDDNWMQVLGIEPKTGVISIITESNKEERTKQE